MKINSTLKPVEIFEKYYSCLWRAQIEFYHQIFLFSSSDNGYFINATEHSIPSKATYELMRIHVYGHYI